MLNAKSKITKVSTVLIVVLFAAFFYGITVRDANRMSWHEQIVTTIFSPFQKTFTSIGSGISNVYQNYFALVGASKENVFLKTQLAEANKSLIAKDDILLENERLRGLLSLKERSKISTIGARVIAADPRGNFRVATIDRGSRDGVELDMPVVSHSGLVGKIADVAFSTSKVLLITDPNSAVDVIVQRSRARGLLVGNRDETILKHGFNLSRFEYLDRKSDIENGDIVITSGFDDLFPHGIPVGEVSGAKGESSGVFKEANIVPYVDFDSLEEVLIVY